MSFEQDNLIIKNIPLQDFEIDGSCKANYLGENLKVFGGLPEEIVDLKVVTRFDDDLICIVNKVKKPSKFRIEPKCKYYLSCSGCQFQHVDYNNQLAIKKKFVLNTLKNIKSFSEDKLDNTVESKLIFNYRNHARFSVSKSKKYKGNIGFINRWTRKLVEISNCEIMNSRINSILLKLKNKLSGYSQFSIRVGTQYDSYLVQPKITEIDDFETGQKSYIEVINNIEHQISSPSFFQVNTNQAERLGEIIRKNINFKGNEVVIDAFSGVGTFSVLLSKYVKKIYCIESSYSSIKDANYNSKSLDNLELIHSEVEKLDISYFNDPIDLIILDPSRKGVHKKGLEWVMNLSPPNLVYVSCDLSTLKNDLNTLTNKYSIRKVIPLDMFPQTKHIECIVTLNKQV